MIISYHDELYTIQDVLGDGSCFFHVLLHQLSNTYKYYDLHDKKKYAKFIRQKLAFDLNMSIWIQLSVSMFYYHKYWTIFLHTISNDLKIPYQECVRVFELYPIKTLQDLYTYTIYKKKIKSSLINSFLQYCLDKYKKKLQTYTEWISDEYFEYISFYFHINLIFIDSKTNTEYHTGLEKKYHKNIYFYCLQEENEYYHYQLLKKISI